MGKINTDNYPNRPFASYQDDDMFILQDNGGETYTTNVGDIKNLADSRIKLEGVQVNGTDLPISGKKVNVDISGKTDLSVIAYTFNSEMGYFKGAYVTYNGKLYEFIQEHTGAWNPRHVREIKATGRYVRAGNGGYNNGDRATCEGYMTKASGNYSHAEGRETQAVGECTHAEGRETIANSIYQHVEGKYNIADNESKYIHIIGNGIDDNNRSNAMTVDWYGNLAVSGEVEDGNGEKISDKADKVTNATSGHLAGLDSTGNLTDSGVSPTEDVTVEGNPITFESPFEQDAKSVVVSVKPIQAGSGTPSPENIRPISGTDEVEIEVSGKNLLNPNTLRQGDYDDTPSTTLVSQNFNDRLKIKAGDICSLSFTAPDDINYYQYIGIVDDTNTITEWIEAFWIPSTRNNRKVTFTSSRNGYLTVIYGKLNENKSAWLPLTVEEVKTLNPQIEFGELSSYEPYKGSTTTIPLPSTLYGGTVRVDEGNADGTKDKIVLDGSDDEGWRQSTGVLHPDRRVFYPFNFSNSKPAGDDGNTNLVSMSSNMYDIGTTSYYDIIQMTSFAIGIGGGASGATIGVNVDGTVIDTVEDFKAWLAQNPLEVCYELATPTTISFDPTDVELLEGTNVVSTNGEKVAVTYGRSLWQDINDLKTDTEGKLNKSNVADVEGDTASKAYSVNDFMLRADGLYKVTQPIAQNASITASNTTKTTIGAVLTALLNS